ncbi:9365_t:CDS:2 [Dentiscutata erythropus]|uniref:9365_t:CDS:1 n=1 Tax=Dentiscutata erythropus TaxID=1348616 RepID=A0A9N9D6F4_9GLOM|nr:9365_t:CDS:2 [Dentiscutata erythropus]
MPIDFDIKVIRNDVQSTSKRLTSIWDVILSENTKLTSLTLSNNAISAEEADYWVNIDSNSHEAQSQRNRIS